MTGGCRHDKTDPLLPTVMSDVDPQTPWVVTSRGPSQAPAGPSAQTSSEGMTTTDAAGASCSTASAPSDPLEWPSVSNATGMGVSTRGGTPAGPSRKGAAAAHGAMGRPERVRDKVGGSGGGCGGQLRGLVQQSAHPSTLQAGHEGGAVYGPAGHAVEHRALVDRLTRSDITTAHAAVPVADEHGPVVGGDDGASTAGWGLGDSEYEAVAGSNSSLDGCTTVSLGGEAARSGAAPTAEPAVGG